MIKRGDVDWVIRAATEEDVESYRDLRLEALRLHPETFGSDYESAAKRPLEKWKERLRRNDGVKSVTYLAWRDDLLIGMATIVRASKAGTIARFSRFMFIRPIANEGWGKAC